MAYNTQEERRAYRFGRQDVRNCTVNAVGTGVFNTAEEHRAYAKGVADEKTGVAASMGTLPPSGGQQSPVNPSPVKQSNQRFRSFAERYLVTRSEGFRKDDAGLEEDTWKCILDAKKTYALINRVGLGIED